MEEIRNGKKNNRTRERQLFRQNLCLRQGRAKTQRKQQEKLFELGKFQMIHDGKCAMNDEEITRNTGTSRQCHLYKKMLYLKKIILEKCFL